MNDITTIATILRTTVKNAPARIVGMKLGPVCGRCGGSGRHSFNQRDGDKCWGCNCAGHVLPKTAAEWQATAERATAAANDGTLDAHIVRLQARIRSKKGKARAFEAWHTLDALNGYGKNWRVLDTLPNKDEVIARNNLGNDLIKALDKLEMDALIEKRAIDWITYDRVLTDGLAAIEAATNELRGQ